MLRWWWMTAVSYLVTIFYRFSLSRLKVKNTLWFWMLPCIAQISPVTKPHTHTHTQSLLVLAATDSNLPSVSVTSLSLSLSHSLTSQAGLREGWEWRGLSACPAGQNLGEAMMMMTASLQALKIAYQWELIDVSDFYSIWEYCLYPNTSNRTL